MEKGDAKGLCLLRNFLLVIISRNGKYYAKLIAIDENEYPATTALTGVFEKAASYDPVQTKEERLKKHENLD